MNMLLNINNLKCDQVEILFKNNDDSTNFKAHEDTEKITNINDANRSNYSKVSIYGYILSISGGVYYINNLKQEHTLEINKLQEQLNEKQAPILISKIHSQDLKNFNNQLSKLKQEHQLEINKLQKQLNEKQESILISTINSKDLENCDNKLSKLKQKNNELDIETRYPKCFKELIKELTNKGFNITKDKFIEFTKVFCPQEYAVFEAKTQNLLYNFQKEKELKTDILYIENMITSLNNKIQNYNYKLTHENLIKTQNQFINELEKQEEILKSLINNNELKDDQLKNDIKINLNKILLQKNNLKNDHEYFQKNQINIELEEDKLQLQIYKFDLKLKLNQLKVTFKEIMNTQKSLEILK